MNKKSSVKKTAAILLGLALAVGGVGCGNFVITDNEKDLAQTVATVNIAESLKTSGEYTAEEAAEVAGVLGSLTTDIKKRDLVAFFLSTGYQYVQSYGYTYEQAFNMMMDGLVSREIMIQYAIAYYLKTNEGLSKAACDTYVVEQKAAAASDKEKALLEAHPEVLTLKYFLTEGGTNSEDYDRAVYNLKKSINDSLDSLETSYIKAESDDHDHGEARTLPTGVDTEKTDYYDTTGKYDVYTGRNTVTDCAPYEKQDGSTTSTRQKAYNAFLANLQGYNLISTSGEIENTSKITNLDYYYVELASLLGQSLVNKYFETLEEDATKELDKEVEPGVSYAAKKYADILAAQKEKYEGNPDAFATAMDSVSDSTFLLYGLDGFGYVYNILLPFSTEQSIEYTRAKNNAANNPNSKQDDLFNARKAIVQEIKGQDQRGSWISAHEHANYSNVVVEGETEKYYFFEDQLTESTKYEKLKQYAGTYAYNGTVDKTDEDEWKVTPKGVGVNEFIKIFNDHINATVGSEVATVYAEASAVSPRGAYDVNGKNTVYTDPATKKVSYDKFMYYTEKVNLGEVATKDYFNATSNIYKAVSAVNELMFAYSTDTGCLNKYFGYSVSPYGTDFVKEFEYAAQYVVDQGAGTYAVCATDYGWHIVFASFVYDGGEVYGGYSDQEAQIEGSFSNLFYESLKTTVAQNHTTEVQSDVLNRYNNASSVTRFKDRYQDLLELQA